MKKSVCFAIMMSLLGMNNLFAATYSDGVAFREFWGVNGGFEWGCKWCASSAGLPEGSDWNEEKFSRGLKNYGDYGTIQYVAHEMVEGGAKFCKTIIGAGRGGCTSRPYTRYFKSGDDCFWLCKDGYHGAGCAKVNKGAADTCQSWARFTGQTFEHTDSKTAQLSSFTPGTDIDSTIPKLYHGVYKNCSDKGLVCFNSANDQEHDVVLAIAKIEKITDDDTLRFFVSPVVVRAAGVRGCWNRAKNYGWPLLYWLKTDEVNRKLLCPEGWVHEDGKCKVDEASEACHLANLCGGFPKEKFDPKIYYTKKSIIDNCYEYRCNSGTAFTSKDDLTCTPCAPADAEIPELYYVPNDGLCHSCNKGKWPVALTQTVGEKTVPSGEYDCEDATTFTHNELQYGDKNVPDKVEPTQCWTKTNPDDFFGCVTGKCRDGDTWEKDGDCDGE